MNTPTPEDIALARYFEDGNYCYGPGQVPQMIADHCAPLRELAEIGRLAVEHRKMDTVDQEASLGRWYKKLTEIKDACDAYLAKGAK
jgi:hypothetical protein